MLRHSHRRIYLPECQEEACRKAILYWYAGFLCFSDGDPSADHTAGAASDCMVYSNEPQSLALRPFLGGTAAITEELGRYIAVRFWLKKNRRYADGIAYGLGHGGIEAMLLIGVNNIANPFIVLSRSTYMAALIAVQLNYATIYIILFERVLAIIVQVGLSMLVFYAVRSEQLRYLIFALVIHTMIDAAIVILPGAFGVSVYWTEAVVFLAAVILMAWMVKIKPRFDPEGAFL